MSEIITSTEQGKVRGRKLKNYYGESFYAFSGIPYAKAPAGNLRFKEPQPPAPWNGTFNARREGSRCPHILHPVGIHLGKENNCLNLNIYTKQLKGNSPVMVFIHGGGFVYGSNERQIHGPKHLMTADIVFVAINYRLGVLGFLSLKDQSLKVPGNNGLKDQVMALKWIQRNIQNFGGDPNNVTVFGESAGSASVHFLMLSPLAKGLFHKAIMQSGSTLNPWCIGRPNALDIAKSLGYSETSEKEILAKLTKEKIKTLVSAQFKTIEIYLASMERPYGPVIEYDHPDAFISKQPLDIMKSGDYNKVPVIVGYNSLEGMFFGAVRKLTHIGIPLSLECYIPYYLKIPEGSKEEKEIAEKIKQFYYKEKAVSKKNLKESFSINGDTNFIYGILKAVQLMSLHHPVYLYRNSLDGPLNFFKMMSLTKCFKTWCVVTPITTKLGIATLEKSFQRYANKVQIPGVSHADDIFYLFSSLFSKNYARGSEEDVCIQKFVRLWTDFAKFSNPTPESKANLDNVVWSAVEKGQIEPIFNIDYKVELCKKNGDKEAVKFWDGIHNYK